MLNTKAMTMAQLDAAIEDWDQVYTACKLLREFGPLPSLIAERERRIREFERLKRTTENIH